MNMKGGKEKEIKDCHKTVKLKEIRNYILLKCWYPAIYRFGKKEYLIGYAEGVAAMAEKAKEHTNGEKEARP